MIKKIAYLSIIIMMFELISCATLSREKRLEEIEAIPTVSKVTKWYYSHGSFTDFAINVEVLLNNGKRIYLADVDYVNNKLTFTYLYYFYNIELHQYEYEIRKDVKGNKSRYYYSDLILLNFKDVINVHQFDEFNKIVKDCNVRDLLMNADQAYSTLDFLPFVNEFYEGQDPDAYMKFVENVPDTITYNKGSGYYKVFRSKHISNEKEKTSKE